MVCANAAYCHKLSLILIGKYKRLAWFANQTFPLKYSAQKRAWIEIPTIWNWFNEVFNPEVRRRTCHPTLLLLDNVSGHFEEFSLPNVTNWKQYVIWELFQRSKRDIYFF